MKKNILLTGATGLIGSRLVPRLIQQGHSLWLTSRTPEKYHRQSSAIYIPWNAKSHFVIPEKIDTVFHLAGASVAGQRWTTQYKREILESRTLSSKSLFESFKNAGYFPESIISSSATGFYGSRADEVLTEHSTRGRGFLSDVCFEWEQSVLSFQGFVKNLAIIRTGIVLDPLGGALPKLLLPFRLFLGGKLGNGKQWFSWIHHEDLINIFMYVLSTEFRGVLNAVAPNPVRMEDFARLLGKVTRRPSFFPAPAHLLRIVLGEAAFEITKSQRVIPAILNELQFRFQYPSCYEALIDLTTNCQ